MVQNRNGHLFSGHCSRSTVVLNDIMFEIESEIRLFADDFVCYRHCRHIETPKGY